jgi:hypothetical protein
MTLDSIIPKKLRLAASAVAASAAISWGGFVDDLIDYCKNTHNINLTKNEETSINGVDCAFDLYTDEFLTDNIGKNMLGVDFVNNDAEKAAVQGFGGVYYNPDTNTTTYQQAGDMINSLLRPVGVQPQDFVNPAKFRFELRPADMVSVYNAAGQKLGSMNYGSLNDRLSDGVYFVRPQDYKGMPSQRVSVHK